MKALPYLPVRVGVLIAPLPDDRAAERFPPDHLFNRGNDRHGCSPLISIGDNGRLPQEATDVCVLRAEFAFASSRELLEEVVLDWHHVR